MSGLQKGFPRIRGVKLKTIEDNKLEGVLTLYQKTELLTKIIIKTDEVLTDVLFLISDDEYEETIEELKTELAKTINEIT